MGFRSTGFIVRAAALLASATLAAAVAPARASVERFSIAASHQFPLSVSWRFDAPQMEVDAREERAVWQYAPGIAVPALPPIRTPYVLDRGFAVMASLSARPEPFLGKRLADVAFGPRVVRAMRLSTSGSVLGSQPLKIGQLPQSARWAELMSEDAFAHFDPDCKRHARSCESALRKRLTAAVEAARHQSDFDAIVTINRAVNEALIFRTDLQSHGVADKWSTVAETLQTGVGDCEEFVLLKLWMLRAAGFEAATLRMQLVRIPRRGEDHAVLVVSVDYRQVVLDNLSEDVRGDYSISEYVPLVSFVDRTSYVHGFQREPAKVAAARQN